MDKQVEQLVKACYQCQLVRPRTKPEPIRSTKLPEGPWNDIAADLLEIPGGNHLLVVTDNFSRWPEVVLVKKTDAQHINTALEGIFRAHGLPQSIRTDNGPPFASKLVREAVTSGVTTSFLQHLAIVVTTSFLQHLGIEHKAIEAEWQQRLRERDAQNKLRQKEHADKKRSAEHSSIAQGDDVLLKQTRENKLDTNFEPMQYKVIRKEGNSILLGNHEGVRKMRNIAHVKN
ncbi:Transposon Tf2-9 poly [Paramuricea clavata]|uniref:Transposon Tf2-9 poly n=1 Tax=Paramuricea clavata TaxID=317549 RepID=A0A7D9JC84_PARCT|nr:Transposon Tf2-9 poly [Paramuricea clavata]